MAILISAFPPPPAIAISISVVPFLSLSRLDSGYPSSADCLLHAASVREEKKLTPFLFPYPNLASFSPLFLKGKESGRDWTAEK